MRIYTPESIVAGCVPVGTKNHHEAAYHAAAYGLDVDAVHLVTSVKDGYIYYLSAPSSDFASHPDVQTPLAAALPGMPGHRGDGGYLAVIGILSCVVIKKGEALYSFVGDETVARQFVASYEVPIYDLGEDNSARWQGFNERLLQKSKRFSFLLHSIGVGLSAVFFSAWMVFGFLNGQMAGKKDAASSLVTVNAEEIKKGVISSQPVLTNISDMQRISSIAMSAGGWVNYYRIDGGTTTWEVEMPMWVTGDYIKSLSATAHAEKQDGKSTILVRQGHKK